MQTLDLSAPCAHPSRRETRRQTRREAILEVAERSFLEHGYAATTMSAIAAELGGSKGTLWSYFPAKDVLFAAVIDHATESFQQQVTMILNPQDEPEYTLRRFARGFVHQVTLPEALALYRLIMGEAGRFPEIGRIFHDRAIGRTSRVLATYLGEIAARGLLVALDTQKATQLAAQQLMTLCLSGCHQMLLMQAIERADPERIEADAADAVTTFMRAYQA